MDITYSSLAYADAIHDFDNVAVAYKRTIASGLPATILSIDSIVGRATLEDTVLDVFMARKKEYKTLNNLTPTALFRLLRKNTSTFGLIGDANGSLPLVSMLEKQRSNYYIIRNIENKIDSANSPLYSNINKGIILHDVITTTVQYPKWSMDHCISSKFCSNYDISIEYITNDHVKYTINGKSLTISLINNNSNPNNKRNAQRIINNSLSTDIDKCMAFQRKRSGDWFQALSSADSERLYELATGQQKLTCPLYFCTEDRVAATYSFAIGLNTIYYQRSSGLLILYSNSVHIKEDLFSCTTMSFDSKKTEEYKRSITKAFELYNVHNPRLQQQLETYEIHTTNDMFKYIGFLFEYLLLEDGLCNLRRKESFLQQFLTDSLSLTDDNKRNIMNLIFIAKREIPEIESRDMDTTLRFPFLENLMPISITGIVGPSEIYLGTLLRCMITRKNLILSKGVEKCIRKIMELSDDSEQIEQFYMSLLDTLRTTGGRATIEDTNIVLQSQKNVPKTIIDLGHTYLAFMSEYTSEPYKDPRFKDLLPIFELGKKRLVCENYDTMLVPEAMSKLVKEYGILSDEFNHMMELIRAAD